MTARASLPRILILQHEAFKKTLDGALLNAPATKPVGRVLDIGTGCGIWAADFAEAHPTAEVVGVDNFPQPTVAAPPNCRFVALDAEQQDWEEALGDAKFDVVHTRLVPFHVSEVQGVLRRCYEHLAPGGWIEMQEAWPPCRTDEPPGAAEHKSKVIQWTQLRLEAAAKLGIDQGIAGRLPGLLSEAGFVEVQVQDHKWPIGPWMEGEKMRGIGAVNLELLRLAMMGLSKELLANLGMGDQEVVGFVEQVRGELGVGRIYAPVRIVWARKPE
ncbi:sam dependent methyltransferase [Coniochaeta ligniaria NRRL 30616]|uniref:Sam dependent methyltransferase n=1 Tax=Coniochaeta ligniaria NRRL 30616 TaxID=1408157 RepID=A0A1J7IJL9_9PEZI|nr:sam dependent methyltransferase [Coniochaeta ligniaria NRRL 30616]